MSERTYTLEEVQKIYHEAFRRGVECCKDVVANGRMPEKAVEYWYHYGTKK